MIACLQPFEMTEWTAEWHTQGSFVHWNTAYSFTDIGVTGYVTDITSNTDAATSCATIDATYTSRTATVNVYFEEQHFNDSGSMGFQRSQSQTGWNYELTSQDWSGRTVYRTQDSSNMNGESDHYGSGLLNRSFYSQQISWDDYGVSDTTFNTPVFGYFTLTSNYTDFSGGTSSFTYTATSQFSSTDTTTKVHTHHASVHIEDYLFEVGGETIPTTVDGSATSTTVTSSNSYFSTTDSEFSATGFEWPGALNEFIIESTSAIGGLDTFYTSTTVTAITGGYTSDTDIGMFVPATGTTTITADSFLTYIRTLSYSMKAKDYDPIVFTGPSAYNTLNFTEFDLVRDDWVFSGYFGTWLLGEIFETSDYLFEAFGDVTQFIFFSFSTFIYPQIDITDYGVESGTATEAVTTTTVILGTLSFTDVSHTPTTWTLNVFTAGSLPMDFSTDEFTWRSNPQTTIFTESGVGMETTTAITRTLSEVVLSHSADNGASDQYEERVQTRFAPIEYLYGVPMVGGIQVYRPEYAQGYQIQPFISDTDAVYPGVGAAIEMPFPSNMFVGDFAAESIPFPLPGIEAMFDYGTSFETDGTTYELGFDSNGQPFFTANWANSFTTGSFVNTLFGIGGIANTYSQFTFRRLGETGIYNIVGGKPPAPGLETVFVRGVYEWSDTLSDNGRITFGPWGSFVMDTSQLNAIRFLNPYSGESIMLIDQASIGPDIRVFPKHWATIL
jgi:hypothetical protein